MEVLHIGLDITQFLYSMSHKTKPSQRNKQTQQNTPRTLGFAFEPLHSQSTNGVAFFLQEHKAVRVHLPVHTVCTQVCKQSPLLSQ